MPANNQSQVAVMFGFDTTGDRDVLRSFDDINSSISSADETTNRWTKALEKMDRALDASAEETEDMVRVAGRLETAIDQARGSANKFGRASKGMGGGFKTSAKSAVASFSKINVGIFAIVENLKTVATVGKAAFDFAVAGAQAAQVAKAFEKLGGTASDLRSLRRATADLIDDTTLQKTLSLGTSFNIAKDTVFELIEATTAFGQQMGKTQEEIAASIEQVIIGFGKAEGGAFEALGITMAEVEDKALAMNPTFALMSKEMQLAAKQAAGLDIILARDLNVSTDDMATKMGQASTRMENFISDLQVMAAEMLINSGILDTLEEGLVFLKDIVEENRDSIETIIKVLGRLASVAFPLVIEAVDLLMGPLIAMFDTIEFGIDLIDALSGGLIGMGTSASAFSASGTVVTDALEGILETAKEADRALQDLQQTMGGVAAEVVIPTGVGLGPTIKEIDATVFAYSQLSIATDKLGFTTEEALEKTRIEIEKTDRLLNELMEVDASGIATGVGRANQSFNTLEENLNNLIDLEEELESKIGSGSFSPKIEPDVDFEGLITDASDALKEFIIGPLTGFSADIRREAQATLGEALTSAFAGAVESNRDAVTSIWQDFFSIDPDSSVFDEFKFFVQDNVVDALRDALDTTKENMEIQQELEEEAHELRMARLQEMQDQFSNTNDEINSFMSNFVGEDGDPVLEKMTNWATTINSVAGQIITDFEGIAEAGDNQAGALTAAFNLGANALSIATKGLIKDTRAQAAIQGALMIARAAHAIAMGIMTEDPKQFIAAASFGVAAGLYFAVAGGAGSSASGGSRSAGGRGAGSGASRNFERPPDPRGNNRGINPDAGRGNSTATVTQIFISSLDGQEAGERVLEVMNKLASRDMGHKLDPRIQSSEPMYQGW